MNIETGEVVSFEAIKSMLPAERAKYVEIKRDLTAREQFTNKINMYAPCGCGSGKKFKFCCHLKKTEST